MQNITVLLLLSLRVKFVYSHYVSQLQYCYEW